MLTVLIAASLLVKGVVRTWSAERGFDADGVITELLKLVPVP